MNLWILTEEKPKISVILNIIELYCKDFYSSYRLFDNYENYNKAIKIEPIIYNNRFQFKYCVNGISINGIDNILIKTVSGKSSFVDFLVFRQEKEPVCGSMDNLLMAIEETKTNDKESRNTSVYQRASKFIYIDAYSKNVKKYMLYNDESNHNCCKTPSDTNIFGTNMLLTIGVSIVGKDLSNWFTKFNSLEDLIEFKSKMRKPPEGNVPIDITRYDDRIEISGRLSKPKDKANIGHDPNIGALSIIAKCIRYLGWTKDIVIIKHGVSQSYIDTHRGNKFLKICSILGIKLDGINIQKCALPPSYWHYEYSSEKVASIFLHIVGENSGMRCIYQNHAGCERGYYKNSYGELIALPKKDSQGNNLYIPDLILHDEKTNSIIIIEGKKLSTLKNGLTELYNYDSIENEYLKRDYPSCKIYRYLTIFGGNEKNIINSNILLYMNVQGDVYINPNSPKCIQDISLETSYKIFSLT